MTDKEIDKLAHKVAGIILTNLHAAVVPDLYPDEEEELLAELARCMTLLDKYLKEEKYEKCEIMKNKIKQIENKLNNL
jgi:hypothetical protein|tara:strand:- start:639 stop:872 length:234 start_codon:yes stop_codon:yes gene_type:complete